MSKPQTYKNPTYTTLESQLCIEHELSKSKGMVFDSIFPFLCSHLFKDAASADFLRIQLGILNTQGVSASNIHLYSLFLALESRNQFWLNKNKKTELRDCLDQIARITALQLGRKAMIAFLCNFSGNESYVTSLNTFLLAEYETFALKNNWTKAVEAGFCLSIEKLSTIEGPSFERLKGELGGFSRDKIAKAVFLVSKIWPEKLSEVVSLLEERAEDDFNNWIRPDFWIAIIESEKVINSSLPSEEIQLVFESLRNTSPKSYEIIRNIQEDGIVVNLESLVRTPNFSPIEDTMTLLAMDLAGRKETVQLTQMEYQRLAKTDTMNRVSNKDLDKSLTIFMIVVFLIATIVFFYAGGLVHEFGMRGLMGKFAAQKLSFDKLTDILSFAFSPIFPFLIGIWWVFNIFKRIRNTRRLTVSGLFIEIPFLKKIIQKINDRTSD